jgi:hypothetical protein
MTTEIDNSERQARAQYEGIVEMIERLEHSAECDGDDCSVANADLIEGLGYGREDRPPTEDEIAQYHDEEAITTMIAESAMCVEFRSDWESSPENMTPGEYRITLCTGGPAVQITGSIDQWGGPDTATLEHQDWFTPWVPFHEIDDATLIRYAQQFVFSLLSNHTATRGAHHELATADPDNAAG